MSIDAVQPVAGGSSQDSLTALHQDAMSQEANWEKALQDKNAVRTYSCYFMVVELINHIGLDKIDGGIIAESQLMDVQHQMQQSLADIGKFISEIQSEEAGYHSFATSGYDTDQWLTPDSFLGLNSSYYNMDSSGGEHFSSSSTYQASMKKFETAIKKIFFCNSDSNAPTVGQLSTISNPNVYQHGQDFDLSGFWNQLSSLYGAANFNKDGFKMVSGVSTDHASLLQQYMYYKAQVAVYSGSTQNVDAAHGDITKLVNFAPVGQESDPFISQVLQIFNQFNVTVSVSNTGQSECGYNPAINTTSGNIMDLILQGHDYNSNGNVGTFGAFNFLAYNSYWSKPNAADGISPNPTSPGFDIGYQIDGQGEGTGDTVASMYTNINSVQASIGNDSGTNSTVMQEMSANEGEIVNVGQNAIQSLNQAVAAFSINQVSS